jgi:UDPglucose--hexose-1-phosphate uridylyltransferase
VAELRVDGLTGRPVLLAAARAHRPHTTRLPPEPADAACPFCPGHEHRTPPEVARVGPPPPDGPGWRVRVVPNLYPIVGGPGAAPEAAGAHEVVILSPDHGRSFADLDDGEAATVLTVMRDRCRAHLAAGAAWATAVVNEGRAAGASIAHPHGQVFALAAVPPMVRRLAARSSERDLVTGDLSEARAAGLTLTDGPVSVWLPAGGWAPYLLRIAAPGEGPVFAHTADGPLRVVALALRDALGWLRAALGAVPYNVVVHSGARSTAGRCGWWIEVLPRLGVPAGFELATGCCVNVVPPEAAAARLRESGAGGGR